MNLMKKKKKSPYFTTRTSSLKLKLIMENIVSYSAKLSKLYETPIPM